MNTQQKIEIESPFKQLSKQLDDPTIKEAAAWNRLSDASKRRLYRWADIIPIFWEESWADFRCEERMALRKAIKTMGNIYIVFGGSNA